jgi:hypothetical protein
MGGAHPRGPRDVGMGIELVIWPIEAVEDACIDIVVGVDVDIDIIGIDIDIIGIDMDIIGIDIDIDIESALFTIPDMLMAIELLGEPMDPCIPRSGPAWRI